MSLTDAFKLFVTVTDAENAKLYKIDMTKISVIFDKSFEVCAENAESFLRYSDGDGESVERSVLENPDAIESQIQQKQLDILGSQNLIKAFITVSAGKNSSKAKIAVDAVNMIAPSTADNSKYACFYTSAGAKSLKFLETPGQIEQQIEDKQRARVKYMKIMMGNAIF